MSRSIWSLALLLVFSAIQHPGFSFEIIYRDFRGGQSSVQCSEVTLTDSKMFLCQSVDGNIIQIPRLRVINTYIISEV